MSVSKWGYEQKKCDGDYCPGDCDNCQKKDEVEKCLTEEEGRTKMKYLILLNKSICQDYIIEASNINEAIYKLYKKTEGPMIEIDDVDLFYTCIKEMKSIQGAVKLYNRFASYSIDKIYTVTAEIYNEDEEERKREARERFQSRHRRYQTAAARCGAVDPLLYLIQIN